MDVGRWPLGVEGCGSVDDREGAGKENQEKQVLLGKYYSGTQYYVYELKQVSK